MGEKAILPATLADSANIWPTLIKLARNADLPRSTRTQSVFWLGQAAGEAATANLNSIVLDNSVDREVRESAVFALSQRPREEGIPALIAVARTNKDPEIRKKAMFWLGQSHDPRAIDLFEELLTRK
jgi:HEAT repeat protein